MCMRIYVAQTGFLYTEIKIISPIKWKGQDCDDSTNDIAYILQLEVFSCLSINVRIEIFRSNGDDTINCEGLHSVVLECSDRHFRSNLFSII